MNKAIPILMYHQVTPNVRPEFLACSITPRTFKIHMNILKLLRFTPINLTQLEDCRNGKSILPKKPILITFDDCYQECIDHAVPILEENGFTAVFFVPTECVGSKSHWLMPELGFEFPIIDWATVKYLDTNGFQVGSHSMTHPDLTNVTSEDCYKELAESRKVLEEHLGHEVVHLAYPYGLFNDAVKSIAAKVGYKTVCSVIERFARHDDDPLALPRINVLDSYNIVDFVLILHYEGKYKTTLRWWQYVHSKMRGVGRLIKKIRAKYTKNN